MPRRVIARERDGITMYYGDFRDYAAQGGKYEALKVPGEHRATRDEKIATKSLERYVGDPTLDASNPQPDPEE